MGSALKKYLIYLIAAVCLILPLSALAAEQGEYQYDMNTVATDWVLENMKEGKDLIVGADGFSAQENVYDTEERAIYKGKTWTDAYTYTLTTNVGGGGDANKILVYFNYQNAENHYYFSAAADNKVRLYRVVNGESSLLEMAEHTVAWVDVKFQVQYNHGEIVILANDTELFRLQDDTFTYGNIGFKFEWCVGNVKNISVSGLWFDATQYLAVESLSIANGSTSVPISDNLAVKFNGNVKADTVTKENITMTGVPESAYDLAVNGDTVTISWNGLSSNTEYAIVFGSGLQMADSGNGFQNGSYTFRFKTRRSENLLHYEYDKKLLNYDWKLSDPGKIMDDDEGNGLKVTDYGATTTAILSAYQWKNQFVYAVDLNNWAQHAVNKVNLYFNYRSNNDYYAISIGGAKTDNPVELYKVVGGATTVLATYDNYDINWNFATFEVNYDNGTIVITAKDKGNGSVTNLFAVEGEVSYGCVGVGTTSSAGRMNNMKVSGEGTDMHLQIAETNIANMEKDVPTDTKQLQFVFRSDIDVKTVLKSNIQVYANGELLPDAAYMPEVKEKRDILMITFANELDQKTEYRVVFSPAFVAANSGVGLSLNESTFSFTTVPPPFYVDATATCNGNAVTSVKDCAGKEIKFRVGVENYMDNAQPYQLTVAVVAGNGKMLSLKYYGGTLTSDTTKVHTDAISVPKDVDEQAKLVYFVWDSFGKMNILYPSSAF